MKVFSTLVTAPTQMAVSLADFKEFIRQYSNHEDTMLTGVLKGTIRQVEEYLQLSLGLQTRLGLVQGPFIPHRLELDMGPVREIISVKYRLPAAPGETATLDPLVYELVGNVLVPADYGAWPTCSAYDNGFQITYTAGLTDHTVSPAVVLDAALSTGVMLWAKGIYDGDDRYEKAAKCMVDSFREGQGV